MATFLLVVGVGIAIFVFFNMKRSHTQDVIDMCKPIVNSWISDRNGVLDSVMCANYKDDALSVNPNARIFVGMFKRTKGDTCGFYIEVLEGRVLLGKTYFPEGITSWHNRLANEAKISGRTLYDMLNLAEVSHHEKFPHWKEIN